MFPMVHFDSSLLATFHCNFQNCCQIRCRPSFSTVALSCVIAVSCVGRDPSARIVCKRVLVPLVAGAPFTQSMYWSSSWFDSFLLAFLVFGVKPRPSPEVAFMIPLHSPNLCLVLAFEAVCVNALRPWWTHEQRHVNCHARPSKLLRHTLVKQSFS